MQISKWGNSLAVRLPSKLVEELGLKEGDEVEIMKGKGPTLEIQRVLDRLEILKELRKYRGLIPVDFKFDRDEANER